MLDAVAGDLAYAAVVLLGLTRVRGALAEHRARPRRRPVDVALGELVAHVATLGAELREAAIEAVALIADRVDGADVVLKAGRVLVERGELLCGGADRRRQAGALGGVRVARAAEQRALRGGQGRQARRRVVALGGDLGVLGGQLVELAQLADRQAVQLRGEVVGLGADRRQPRKRRLAGAFLAVFVGVSFLSGALVLGQTLQRNFDSLFADVNAGTDAVVRSATKVTADSDFERGPISAATVQRVRSVPGVAFRRALRPGLRAAARSEDPDRAVHLARRAFLAGGPIHGVGFGLLIGALGLAGLRTRALPRPVALTALASVPPNLLGPLYLLAEPAGWFIPAGRFPGLIVAGIAGARLSRSAQTGRRAH